MRFTDFFFERQSGFKARPTCFGVAALGKVRKEEEEEGRLERPQKRRSPRSGKHEIKFLLYPQSLGTGVNRVGCLIRLVTAIERQNGKNFSDFSFALLAFYLSFFFVSLLSSHFVLRFRLSWDKSEVCSFREKGNDVHFLDKPLSLA